MPQTAPFADDRLPGGLRTGPQFLAAIAGDGRRVFVDGEEVKDVTTKCERVKSVLVAAFSIFDRILNTEHAKNINEIVGQSMTDQKWKVEDSVCIKDLT